jgi:transposase
MGRIKYKEAIGLKVKRGRPAIGKKPGKARLFKLYHLEGKSIREIASILGCTKDMVHRALLEYKIDRRDKSKTKESILSKYPLSKIKKIVEGKGYREAANNLGVGSSTLYFYIKRREK